MADIKDNINPYIRQMKIDQITDTSNLILEWFKELWLNLNIIDTNVYNKDGGESIYYIIVSDVKKVIFYQDKKNSFFQCDYYNYWSILELRFNLKYKDIQDITKFLVESFLNNNVVCVILTPVKATMAHGQVVDNVLKNISEK